jgi:hypothetical protein
MKIMENNKQKEFTAAFLLGKFHMGLKLILDMEDDCMLEKEDNLSSRLEFIHKLEAVMRDDIEKLIYSDI